MSCGARETLGMLLRETLEFISPALYLQVVQTISPSTQWIINYGASCKKVEEA